MGSFGIAKRKIVQLIAKTVAGIEPVLARELRELGAKNVSILRRGVAFEGDQRLLYRSNVELHTALRILVPIDQFQATHEDQFYNKVKQIDWSRYLDIDETFAIDSIVHSSYFKHSHYISLKTKDAIVDQFREKEGKRPSVDVRRPKIRIHVHIHEKECSIALDSSGESLHKRGHRVETVEAPINEVLAAGLIGLTGWKGDCDFIDPMCGSGTFLIEAALWAYNIAPQLHRKSFGFTKWNDFDKRLLAEIKQNAEQAIKPFNHSIWGFDKSFKAIKATQRNILAAQMEGKIKVDRRRFEKLDKPVPNGLIIMNPPYDERLHDLNINDLYSAIGDQLKQVFTGYTAWILSSNKSALKHIGLRPSKKIVVFNGKLECKFQQYEMYTGSKKARKSFDLS